MQHVFVYGTLRAGESNDIRLAAERNGIAAPMLIGSGHINGRLYDFDAYPGLVLDSVQHVGLLPDEPVEPLSQRVRESESVNARRTSRKPRPSLRGISSNQR